MDEKLPPPSPEQQEATLQRERVTRRTFLMNVGIALNAIVGLAIATPVIAYLVGPITRRKEYRHWIALGRVNDFKPGETRLVNFGNPFTESWDGMTAKVPAYVRCTPGLNRERTVELGPSAPMSARRERSGCSARSTCATVVSEASSRERWKGASRDSTPTSSRPSGTCR